MILELDCGNTLIKWRLLDSPTGQARAAGLAESASQLVEALGQQPGRPRRCRLVSVRTEQETRELVTRLQQAFGLEVSCARPAAELAGVRNGYRDYQRLGLDRWMALVAAWQLCRRACLVLDLGTAVTADFVATDGTHLGGYICPGLPQMRQQLRNHTSRIRYNSDEARLALHELRPGQCTAEAVERGCLLMLQGFASLQQQQARQSFGENFDIFLTGGDAGVVVPVLPQARVVPELVFIGLALACP